MLYSNKKVKEYDFIKDDSIIYRKTDNVITSSDIVYTIYDDIDNNLLFIIPFKFKSFFYSDDDIDGLKGYHLCFKSKNLEEREKEINLIKRNIELPEEVAYNEKNIVYIFTEKMMWDNELEFCDAEIEIYTKYFKFIRRKNIINNYLNSCK